MGWRSTLVAAIFLTSCVAPASSGSQHFSRCEGSDIILLPHHLLVENYIEDMYRAIGIKDEDKVIIISPNHLLSQYPPVNEAAEEEFGFTPHRDFAEKYFPNAEVEGWMIQQGASQESLDGLIEELAQEDATFVFSVDFSHYLPGDLALVHDLRSQDIIEAGLAEDALTLEVDSPEALYVMLKLAGQKELSIEIIKNTNPQLDASLSPSFENTTHMFGCSSFEAPKERQLNVTMYFENEEEFYQGLTEEDRYLYGYDEACFEEEVDSDTAIIEHADGSQDIYKFDYFN